MCDIIKASEGTFFKYSIYFFVTKKVAKKFSCCDKLLTKSDSPR